MAQSKVKSFDSQTVLAAGTRVTGRVSGNGELLLEGSIEGEIALSGNLTIDEGAQATGDVKAADVTVRGVLEGNIDALGVVQIGRAARVTGDISGSGVAIEDGAQFFGKLDFDFDLPAGLR
jgi:cytoskeletal protein CcmA (bactofilin family)